MSEAATIDGNDVLIVVDVQKDFCPGGALAVPRGDEIVPIVNRLAARFHSVVLTQDWHPSGHFSFGSRTGEKILSRPSPHPMARRCCGPIIACKEHRAPHFTPRCKSRTPPSCCARAWSA